METRCADILADQVGIRMRGEPCPQHTQRETDRGPQRTNGKGKNTRKNNRKQGVQPGP